MTRMQQKEEITIIGFELRTNNKVAFETIPAFWDKFYRDKLLGELSDNEFVDLFAVYTNYEDAGYSSEGEYSFIIGVSEDDIDKEFDHLAVATIPTQEYIVFNVAENKKENIVKTWNAITNNKIIERTYDVDYECYTANGYIDVVVGVR